jgi:hypothetical protein
MNTYVEWRLNIFHNYFNKVSNEQQIDMVKNYTWNFVSNILWLVSGRDYCSLLAWFLIEEWKIKIWLFTFEQLVDEIEFFFIHKKRKLYPKWQRDLLAFLYKKSRNNIKKS